jgi:hypothetical protein
MEVPTVLMAHPVVLRKLVDEYRALQILHAQDGSPECRRRLEDVTYTLCVSTGTRTAEQALLAAERRLEAALVDLPVPEGASGTDVRLSAA